MVTRPRIIYGTAWKKESTADLVLQAIRAGFRGIDTACQPKHYNQPGTGHAIRRAIEQGLCTREELFIQTKYTSLDGQDRSKPLPYDANAPLEEQVRQSLQTSLKELETDYIDSLLMHSPMSTLDATLQVWKVFEEFVSRGVVKTIGLSNCYDPRLLGAVISHATVKPSFIQNRFYASTGYDSQILKLCKKHDIVYQSFWTLTGQPPLLLTFPAGTHRVAHTANPHILQSAEIGTIARRMGYTPAQAFFKYLIHRGIVPLSGTTSREHADQDVAVAESTEMLKDTEEKAVDALLQAS